VIIKAKEEQGREETSWRKEVEEAFPESISHPNDERR
jgi:hypothetical protein